MSTTLHTWGWNSLWAEQWGEQITAPSTLVPGRVIAEFKGGYQIVGDFGQRLSLLAGRLRHRVRRSELSPPCVGDWVALSLPAGDGTGQIQALLPRKTALVRKAAGDEEREQVLAANVDLVLLVSALAPPFNLRRLERALALAHESGAQPVVVLSQADLVPDRSEVLAQVNAIAEGVPVEVVSAVTGEGMTSLAEHLAPELTAVLLGPSGVGKSTLANHLLKEERQATQSLGEDGRGRHTTTHRELFALPSGALLIDTPGVRELGLWLNADEVKASFPEIEELAARCRFSDCQHRTEPGCAVRGSVDAGELPAERLEAYLKLCAEASHREAASDEHARRERKRNDKIATRALEAIVRNK